MIIIISFTISSINIKILISIYIMKLIYFLSFLLFFLYKYIFFFIFIPDILFIDLKNPFFNFLKIKKFQIQKNKGEAILLITKYSPINFLYSFL